MQTFFVVFSQISCRAQGVYKLVWQLYFFDIGLVVLPSHIHKSNLACLLILAHVKLLAEQVTVFYFNQWLDVSVAQVYQVDGIFIPRYHVWQLIKVVREERLDVSGVRVVPWVFDFLRLVFW